MQMIEAVNKKNGGTLRSVSLRRGIETDGDETRIQEDGQCY